MKAGPTGSADVSVIPFAFFHLPIFRPSGLLLFHHPTRGSLRSPLATCFRPSGPGASLVSQGSEQILRLRRSCQGRGSLRSPLLKLRRFRGSLNREARPEPYLLRLQRSYQGGWVLRCPVTRFKQPLVSSARRSSAGGAKDSSPGRACEPGVILGGIKEP